MTVPTDRQREAIDKEAARICVDAAAGSGKTSVLIGRFIRLLEEGARMDRIVALTFTRAATSQMRQRLIFELKKRGRTIFARQAIGARIHTIHGFCRTVLTAHAFDSGVVPGHRALDDAVARDLLELSVSEALDEVKGTVDGDALDEHLEWRYERDSGGFVVAIADLITALRGRGLSLTGLGKSVESDVERVVAEIERCVYELSSLSPQPAATAAKIQAATEFDFRRLLVEENTVSGIREVVGLRKRIDIKVSSVAKSAMAFVCKTIDHELLPMLAERIAVPVRSALERVVARAVDGYDERKHELGALDFPDLEWKTRRLLTEYPGVRDTIASGVEHLLVDEYQDTSPIQDWIIRSITPEGGLFIVGDEMQSIYGFRNADVRVFRKLREEVGSNGRVFLKETFRAVPELCAFVNHVFGKTGDESLVPLRDDFPSVDHRVQLRVVDETDMSAGRKREAEWIARNIRSMHDKREVVRDGNADGKTRPLLFDDVMILSRTHGMVPYLRRALREMEVPTVFRGGGGFADTREIVDATALLRLVDRPEDDYWCVVVLRGPTVSLSDDAVLSLVLSRNGGSLWEAWRGGRGLEGEEKARARRTAGIIERLHERRGRMRLGDLVSSVISETRLAVRCGADGRRMQARANLCRLVKLADGFEPLGDNPISEFVDRLGSGSDGWSRQESLPETEAVRVSTIHDAKGLEASIVFVSDMGRPPKTKGDPLTLSRDGVLGLEVVASGLDPMKTLSLLSIRAEVEQFERREELRLRYVAFTRARDRLFLSGTVTKRSKGTWLSWLCEQLGVDPRQPKRLAAFGDVYKVLINPETQVSDQVIGANDQVETRTADFASILQRVRTPPPGATFGRKFETVTGLIGYDTCPRRYLLSSCYRSESPTEIDDVVGSRDDVPDDNDTDGLGLGRLVHLAVEHGVRSIEGIDELCSTFRLPASTAERAMDVLLRLDSLEFAELMRANRCEHEVEVIAGIRMGMVRGRVDILIDTGVGYTIADLKTGSRLPGGHMLDEYTRQVQAYALMLTRLRGRPPSGAFLIYPAVGRSGAQRDVAIGAENLTEIETRLSAAIAGIRNGEFGSRKGDWCVRCPVVMICGADT